jgi:hypothetical protein
LSPELLFRKVLATVLPFIPNGQPKGVVTKLFSEKKGLIPALQQLSTGYQKTPEY